MQYELEAAIEFLHSRNGTRFTGECVVYAGEKRCGNTAVSIV
jgi:hypothetical protein